MNMKNNYCAAGLAVLCLSAYSASAQTNDIPSFHEGTFDSDWTAAQSPQWKMALSADYTAVASGGTSFDGIHGNSGAQSADVDFRAEIPVDEAWFVPVSLISHDIFLDTIGGVPIPNHIDTLGINTGLGYHLNDQWTFAASLGPRFYSLDSADGQDIGIGGAVRAIYKVQPNLTVAFGLAFNPDSDVPVLPAAGLRWEIQSNLSLSLMFPKSGLDYRLNSKLSFFAGFDGEFTVFRDDEHLGNRIGLPQYNSGLGTYRDFHGGVGVEYRILPGLTASVEGGYSFDRELDYKRIGETLKFQSAPYVQVGLKYGF